MPLVSLGSMEQWAPLLATFRCFLLLYLLTVSQHPPCHVITIISGDSLGHVLAAKHSFSSVAPIMWGRLRQQLYHAKA